MGVEQRPTIVTGGSGIPNDGSVSNVKMANVPANSVKANATATVGIPQDVAVADSALLGRPPGSDLSNVLLHSSFSWDVNTIVPSVYWDGTNFRDDNGVAISLPSGLTYGDLNASNYTRWDATNLVIIDGAGNPISGVQSMANYNTLISLSTTTYANFAFIVESGVNKSVWVPNGSVWEPLNGQYRHDRSSVPSQKIVLPNAAVTWTASNNAGKTRLTSSADHGLTEANSEGNCLQVLSGTAWTPGSNHQITPGTGYVSTTVLDTETPWNASFGAPTFAVKGTVDANSMITLKDIILPGLRDNTIAELIFAVVMGSNATVTSRRIKVFLDGVEITNHNTTANNTYYPYSSGFANKNSKTAQRGLHGLNSNGYNLSTQAPVDATVDTTAAGKVLKIAATVDLVDTPIELSRFELLIRG